MFFSVLFFKERMWFSYLNLSLTHRRELYANRGELPLSPHGYLLTAQVFVALYPVISRFSYSQSPAFKRGNTLCLNTRSTKYEFNLPVSVIDGLLTFNENIKLQIIF